MPKDPNRENRGRSDEARDPNRPIDPETGEKEGLGRRETVTETETTETVVEPVEPEQPEG
jgi:hypothetical protein